MSIARQYGQYRCTNKDCPRHKKPFDVKFLRCQKCAAPLEPVDPEKPPTGSAPAGTSSGPGSPSNPTYGNPYVAVPTDWSHDPSTPCDRSQLVLSWDHDTLIVRGPLFLTERDMWLD